RAGAGPAPAPRVHGAPGRTGPSCAGGRGAFAPRARWRSRGCARRPTTCSRTTPRGPAGPRRPAAARGCRQRPRPHAPAPRRAGPRSPAGRGGRWSTGSITSGSREGTQAPRLRFPAMTTVATTADRLLDAQVAWVVGELTGDRLLEVI